MKHPYRTGLTAAVGAALCLPMLAATTAATAHEGHGDTAPPPPAGSFQKVTLNDRPGEPMDLAVLPDGDVLHTTRAGTIWHNDAKTGVNSIAGRSRSTSTTRRACRASPSTRATTARRTTGSTSTTRRRSTPPPTTRRTASINEGDAPETGTAADFAPYKGFLRVSKFRYSGGQVAARHRAAGPRRARSTAASAATSAATSSSTPPAT